MTHDDYRYFKHCFKRGNKLALILVTDEVIVPNTFKSFKYWVKILHKENTGFTVRHIDDKTVHIKALRDTIEEIRNEANLIGEDTIWHDYADKLDSALSELLMVI